MRPEILYPYFAALDSVAGIGKKTAALCEKLGCKVVFDLLAHMPTGVIDRRLKTTIADAPENSVTTIEVTAVEHRKPATRKSPYRVLCRDETGEIAVIFFHAYGDYPAQALPLNQARLISGKVERANGFAQMLHPDYIVPPSDLDKIPAIECVYPLTAGLSGKVLNKAIRSELDKLQTLPEWQDTAMTVREKWQPFNAALATVHAPKSEDDLSALPAARARLAYDELLANQLALALVRKSMKKLSGRQIKGNGKIRKHVLDGLSFSLTGAQIRVLKEINADMESSDRMLRLVQGDVGSGKTLVALFAMLNAVEAGAQAALMAPTDILANQHFATLQKFAGDAVDIVLLTGRDKGKKRQEILDKISSGQADIIVGTHALFSEDVAFKDLALTVIDEQHKFGVHQRLSLSEKGTKSDMLVMTATPIPRTLALTYYGDMDVSQIDELPPGRKEIATRVLPAARLDEVAAALGRSLADGNKAYWVCPLVEESEKIDLAAAEQRFEYLSRLYPNRVGLVHGKMKSAEKDAIMQKFAGNELDILVATTVIEVGVDVPAATVMVIEHSERFGLAQLHQLRGRIGRGQKASTCLLLYTDPLGETAKARLTAMRETQDGFKIAEQDLILRGAGEVLGTKQSGLPEFKIADLAAHTDLLKMASNDAKYIMNIDPELKSERGKALRVLLYLFGKDEAVKTLKAG